MKRAGFPTASWNLTFGILTLFTITFLSPFHAEGQAPQTGDRVRVLIAFHQTPGPNEEALVRSFGGTIRYTYHLVPAIAASVPQTAIQGLQNHPNVARVEPDGEVHAIDAELDNAWGVKHIGAGIVHDGGNLGDAVRVAIIDSGIDYTHPDLNNNYFGGYDFVNGDSEPLDDNGHGTHVGGTVAAENNDAGVVGVAPMANLHALKVLNSSGSGNWSDVIAALEWAVDNFIQVTNNSYGSDQNPGGTVQAAFDNSYAAGVLHVAAAGNSGNPRGNGNKVGWPARYDSVIAVAATDQNDTRAWWSSTGDAVELAAPGVSILSTVPGDDYASYSGTSMASPHVAGTAALVIACGISDSNGDGKVNDEVRTILQQTADDLGDAGRDPHYGFGLVDADEAAGSCGTTTTNATPTVSITSPADGSTFESGATILFEGTASDTEDGDLQTAGLVWTSSIDGQIGTGGSFSTTLSDGNHTITAKATDSGGKIGSDSISITVGSSSTGSTVSVNSITYTTDGGRNNDKHLNVHVALVDDQGNPVAGASVSVTLFHDSGTSWNGSGTTGSTGTVTFTLKNAPSGTYTTDVTDVTADGYTWDGITPENSFTK